MGTSSRPDAVPVRLCPVEIGSFTPVPSQLSPSLYGCCPPPLRLPVPCSLALSCTFAPHIPPRTHPLRSLPALRLDSHATPRARPIVRLARSGTDCSVSHPFNPANKSPTRPLYGDCMNVYMPLISRWHHAYVIPGVCPGPDPLASLVPPGRKGPQASTRLDHNPEL